MDTREYRSSEAEQPRAKDLFRLLPQGMRSVLEIGASDGFHTEKLTTLVESVTALDLERPGFSIERVTTVQGMSQR